jgi:hypothetical protein
MRTRARRWPSARGVESWQTLLVLRAAIVAVPRRSPRAFFARRPALRWVVAPAFQVLLQVCYSSVRFSSTERLVFMPGISPPFSLR